jgi:hypothetical protein
MAILGEAMGGDDVLSLGVVKVKGEGSGAEVFVLLCRFVRKENVLGFGGKTHPKENYEATLDAYYM